MRKASKVLIGLAAFSLVAAACGDDDDDDSSSEDTAAAEEEATEEEAAEEEATEEEAAEEEATEEEAAGEEAAASEGGPIWVLLPDSASSPRWEADDRRFFKAGFEEAGLVEGEDFTIVNAEGDCATQIQQAEQAVAEGASVILLVNLDSGSGATIIEIAREGGAAVIDYDRLTAEGDGADVYVSFDNEAVGRTMASVSEPLSITTWASSRPSSSISGSSTDAMVAPTATLSKLTYTSAPSPSAVRRS